MPWYNAGTIQVTANGTTATGTGTAFIGNVRIGDAITIAGSTALHEVTGVTSNTQLTFQPPYAGSAGSGKAYRIAPVLGYDKDLSDAFNQIRLQWGTQLSSLQPWAYAATADIALGDLGGSASGIAVFKGTQAQGRTALGLGSAATATLNTTVTDSTPDRVMRTGSGGILGQASSNNSGPASAQGGMWYDTSLGTFPAATAYLNVPGTRSFALGARNNNAWIYTYGDTTPLLLTLLTDRNSPKASGGQAAANGELWVQSDNGMYGLGATTALNMPTQADIDNPAFGLNGSSYRVTNAITTGLPAGTYQLTIKRSAGVNACFQEIVGMNIANRKYTRMVTSTGPTPWVQTLDSENTAKTTSDTDTTVGRVWTQTANGMFGIGGDAPSRSTADLDVFHPTSAFRTATTDKFGILGCGIHARSASDRAVQFIGSVTGFTRFMGRTVSSGGTWNNPVEFWHTGNLTPNVLASYTLATLPNAAANPRLQAWCSNLTGGAMPVYSDGTNWRRTFDNSIAN